MGATRRSGGSAREVAVGSLPYLRLMSTFPLGAQALQFLPRSWSQFWQGEVRSEERPNGLAGQTAETSGSLEDAIENDEDLDDSFLGDDW